MPAHRFAHLHVHSGYSLLDGAARIDALVQRAKEYGLSALALTDHGNLFGAIEFYQACRAAGVKPLLGMEAYLAVGSRHERVREEKYDHLVLLARTREGFQNLIRLSSQSYQDGFYYKPRIDLELLERWGAGLLSTSACLAGPLARSLLAGDATGAEEKVRRFQGIFGAEHFFLELQDHGLPEQRTVNAGLRTLAGRTGAPLVCSNDVHYLRREDSDAHDCLICLGRNEVVSDARRQRYEPEKFYLKSYEEMCALFADCREAVENTHHVAALCDVDLGLDQRTYHLPHFECPAGRTPAVYLRALCLDGLRRRFGGEDGPPRARLESELAVIEETGLSSYFLIVWDFVAYAKRRGIPVGPGRGSAAGSLTAYVLGITDVDPLKYDLLFERFLTTSRQSMPDIDIDFCKDGREEIIRYVKEKYGADNVCQIMTFGTLGSKVVLRDVGRVQQVDLAKTDRLARQVPMNGAVPHDLERAPEVDREFGALVASDPEYRRLYEVARQLEGLPRQTGVHAAGVVIADRPLTEYVPLYRTDDALTTQWGMRAIEQIGLLKMDFLGLRNLTIIEKCRQAVAAQTGAPPEFGTEYDDPAVYELLARGETKGVFQVESAGMRALLIGLKPNRFADLIAVLALYRPGPLGEKMDVAYVARKHGREPVTYLDPRLEPILADTYGVILYQEQVMLIAHRLAGFTLAEADGLRKAMGKKDAAVMARYQPKFLAGAAQAGLAARVAAELWQQMEKFAKYGFNKSHSAGYAVLSYQTAYLKAHFPIAYMAALLTCVIDRSDSVVEYIGECRRMGVEVLPPDVNESGGDFTVVNGRIRFGLGACRGVGHKAAEAIVRARAEGGPFRDFFDTIERVDHQVANKAVWQALVKAGAFDAFGTARRALSEAIDRGALEAAAHAQKARAVGQGALFGTAFAAAEPAARPGAAGADEWPEREKLAFEKEALGFWISRHPLAAHERLLAEFSVLSLDRLAELPHERRVLIGGVIHNIRPHIAQSGRNQGKRWATLALEDLTGLCEVSVYAQVYEQYGALLADDALVFVAGRVDRQREEPRVVADELVPFDEAHARLTRAVRLCLALDRCTERDVEELHALVRRHPGRAQLHLLFEAPDGAAVRLVPQARYSVGYSDALREEVERLIGPGRVQVSAGRG